MKKIFASDFDNTLFFRTEKELISPQSLEAIRRFQAQGNLFGLCTGRPLVGVSPFLDLIRPDFVIASSGAHVVGSNHAPLFQKGIRRSVAEEITDDLLTRGYTMMFCVDDHIGFFEPIPVSWAYTLVSRLHEAPQGLVYQISIHCKAPEDTRRLITELTTRYGEELEAFQNLTDIDLAPKGCSKGGGLRLIAEHFSNGQEPFRLYGIGDSLNDLSLLEAADVSFTFPYAPPLLQAKATRVVDTIQEALEQSRTDGTDSPAPKQAETPTSKQAE